MVQIRWSGLDVMILSGTELYNKLCEAQSKKNTLSGSTHTPKLLIHLDNFNGIITPPHTQKKQNKTQNNVNKATLHYTTLPHMNT